MTDDVLDFMAIDVVATDSDDEVTTMACLLTGPIQSGPQTWAKYFSAHH
jgi:hypothetical protein